MWHHYNSICIWARIIILCFVKCFLYHYALFLKRDITMSMKIRLFIISWFLWIRIRKNTNSWKRWFTKLQFQELARRVSVNTSKNIVCTWLLCCVLIFSFSLLPLFHRFLIGRQKSQMEKRESILLPLLVSLSISG